MIRLRDRFTGAEAAWDQTAGDGYRWSGDPGLVRLLDLLMRVENLPSKPGPGYLPSTLQAMIAERLPVHGLVVLEQTPPVDPPRFDSRGIEIIE